ncbi:hypothetical protein ACFL6L_03110 [candidate division KSB1 bacterium]
MSHKTLLIWVINCLILLLSACGGPETVDPEEIVELYAEIMYAFNREDLHGVMKHTSKDFTSDIEDQTTYDEVRKYRQSFILNNRNVNIDFENIEIDQGDSEITVTYDISMVTHRLREKWTQVDILTKTRGSWEIVSSTVASDR